MYYAAIGLMCGEDQDFGYLYVFGGTGCIVCYVGYVGSCEWGYAFIYVFGSLGVSMESYIAEVGLYKAWLEVGDAYG